MYTHNVNEWDYIWDSRKAQYISNGMCFYLTSLQTAQNPNMFWVCAVAFMGWMTGLFLMSTHLLQVTCHQYRTQVDHEVLRGQIVFIRKRIFAIQISLVTLLKCVTRLIATRVPLSIMWWCLCIPCCLNMCSSAYWTNVKCQKVFKTLSKTIHKTHSIN